MTDAVPDWVGAAKRPAADTPPSWVGAAKAAEPPPPHDIPGGKDFGVPGTPAKKAPVSSVMDEIIGAGETAWSVGSGMAGGLVGSLAGIGKQVASGFPRDTSADKFASDIQRSMTYSPKTEAGQRDTGIVGDVVGNLIGATPELGRIGAMQSMRPPSDIPTPPKMTDKQVRANELMDQGIKLTPSMTGSTSRTGKLLEAIGGPAQTRNKASVVNEETLNKLAAKDLGLPDGTPINKQTVDPILKKYGAVRKKIDGIKDTYYGDDALRDSVKKVLGDKVDIWAHEKGTAPPEYQSLINDMLRNDFTPRYLQAKVRNLRETAGENYRKGESQLANAQKATATALEDFLERRMRHLYPGLVPEFVEARKMTAKVYDYLDAANEVGDISAPKMARGDQSKLTGNAKDIASAGSLYPKAVRPSSAAPYAEHSALDALGAVASVTAGKPSGALDLLLGRPMARNALMSDFGQNKFVRPGLPKPPSVTDQVWAAAQNNPALMQLLIGQPPQE